jgi:hypothetical protein
VLVKLLSCRRGWPGWTYWTTGFCRFTWKSRCSRINWSIWSLWWTWSVATAHILINTTYKRNVLDWRVLFYYLFLVTRCSWPYWTNWHTWYTWWTWCDWCCWNTRRCWSPWRSRRHRYEIFLTLLALHKIPDSMIVLNCHRGVV